jgi:hypothetical protein
MIDLDPTDFSWIVLAALIIGVLLVTKLGDDRGELV